MDVVYVIQVDVEKYTIDLINPSFKSLLYDLSHKVHWTQF